MLKRMESLAPQGFKKNFAPLYNKIEKCLGAVHAELLPIIKKKLDQSHEILSSTCSDTVKRHSQQDLIQYVEACENISKRQRRALDHLDLLPPVLKKRLLSTLKKKASSSSKEAAEFLIKAEQKILKPAECILNLYNNHFTFNSSYSEVFWQSKSLKERWEKALKEGDQKELNRIKELFGRLNGSTETEDTLTTKQLFKLLKRAMKRSVADIHQLATFHQMQSSKDRWVDADSLRCFKSDEVRAEKFRFNLQQEHGFNLESQLYTKDHINRCRFAEEMAFITGMGEIAREEGATYAGHLTCTLPSRFHHSKSGKPNPDYEFKTVKDGHDFLQEGWSKTRGFLSYHQKLKHFVKVFQPHESGVAHIHVVAFLNNKDHIRLFVMQIAKYLDQENNWSIHWSPDEREHAPGSNSEGTGIVFKLFSSTKNDDCIQNAVRYCLKSLKYSFASGPNYEDRDAEEIEAIQAWCATHNIRRYSSSVVGKTLWRELRKLPNFDCEAQRAAKDGDYARFYRITQRDLTEALVQMPKNEQNPNKRTWAFAKKFQPSSDLVFVDFIELPPLAKNKNKEVGLPKSSEVVNKEHHIFTVVSNNRDSEEPKCKNDVVSLLRKYLVEPFSSWFTWLGSSIRTVYKAWFNW